MSESRRVLAPEELAAALENLPEWELRDGKLQKAFKFRNFGAALAFMVAAGVEAEKMNHHPEWTNSYNRVEVKLVTHDLGNQVSSWDVRLAKKMESIAAR